MHDGCEIGFTIVHILRQIQLRISFENVVFPLKQYNYIDYLDTCLYSY